MKKMEAEMEQVFEMKVQEKMQKLKDIEADVSGTTTASVTVYCSIVLKMVMLLRHANPPIVVSSSSISLSLVFL